MVRDGLRSSVQDSDLAEVRCMGSHRHDSDVDVLIFRTYGSRRVQFSSITDICGGIAHVHQHYRGS